MKQKKAIVLFHGRTLHEKNYRHYSIPYSILSLASVLDQAVCDVILIDNNLVGKDDFSSDLKALRPNLSCVGISAMIGHQIRDGLNFAKQVRDLDPTIPIIWGGALPTLLPQETLAHENVDVVVIRQGEATFRELVDAFHAGTDLSTIRGIGFKKEGQQRFTDPREFSDLNEFPPYAYDLIDVAAYIRFDEHINTNTVSYHSSQGCPFGCGFCSEVPLWERKWSGLTADRILNDAEYLVSQFGVNGIKFYDSEFFINRNRVFEFANGLIRRGLNVSWAASVHPKNIYRLDHGQLDLLARSGAKRFLIGAESGVQEEIDLIGKGINPEMIIEIARRLASHDIVASFTFVTGYPGFPSSYIDVTLEFAALVRQIDPRHEAKIHLYSPYPGTPLYQHARQHGFKPPRDLLGWSFFDYYYITTPWVDKEYESVIRVFNEGNYPYLHPLAESPAGGQNQGSYL